MMKNAGNIGVTTNKDGVENIEINLQDDFFKKKPSEEKNNNMFKNLSLNKILDEFYNKNATPNNNNLQKRGSLNSSSLGFGKYQSAKQVNQPLVFKTTGNDKASRSKSNKRGYERENLLTEQLEKYEKQERQDRPQDKQEKIRNKPQPKKSTPLNMVNKNTNNYVQYGKYGIYPDRNNPILRDQNIMNRLKHNMERNKVKTGEYGQQQPGHPVHGHNHSLSISVVTINDEIVFNSENPNENFNLDDTGCSKIKEVLYNVKTDELGKPIKDKNSGGTQRGINNNNLNHNNPIIQFNQFNTFQVKPTTNYDNIFEQPKGSKITTKVKQNLIYPNEFDKKSPNVVKGQQNMPNMKSNINTDKLYEFNADFHHDMYNNIQSNKYILIIIIFRYRSIKSISNAHGAKKR